jgi:hypothetical protein
MKPLLASAAAAALCGLLGAAATAHADPLDPHVPDITRNHCPGGRGGFGTFWCDGEHYPDGSYWHQTAEYNSVAAGRMTCVIDNGSILPPVAPSGSCGGG